MKKEIKYKLMPLHIPTGWKILWNHFKEIDPDNTSPDDDEAWLFSFVQDTLYIVHDKEKNGKAIDLGWYPEGDPKGSYGLVVIENQNWEKPLEEFHSRSPYEVAEKIEEYLIKYL